MKKDGVTYTEHNHLEDGWAETEVPNVIVRGGVQEKWKFMKWKKIYGYLEDNKFTKA